MQRACKEGFLLELLVVRRDVFAQFNRPVGRLFLPLFFCVVVVDLSFRSIFHAYETRLSKGRPAHFTHSVVCSFPSFPSFFPLWCCAMRHAPCAAPPWWSDYDDWRLVPHGNGPWQWSMVDHGPWPHPPPSPLLLRYLRYHFSSLFFHVHFASRGAAQPWQSHTQHCAWPGLVENHIKNRREEEINAMVSLKISYIKKSKDAQWF